MGTPPHSSYPSFESGNLTLLSIASSNHVWVCISVPTPSSLLPCRDGCHHCGTRSGPVIGDHIPPNVVAYGAGYKARLQVSRSPTAPSPQAKQALLKALKFVGEAAVTRLHLKVGWVQESGLVIGGGYHSHFRALFVRIQLCKGVYHQIR